MVFCQAFLLTAAVFVNDRIAGIEILGVQAFLDDAERFAKSLEVYDFPGAQEANGINNIRVFDYPQDIVVSASRFLLCCDLVRTHLIDSMHHPLEIPVDFNRHVFCARDSFADRNIVDEFVNGLTV